MEMQFMRIWQSSALIVLGIAGMVASAFLSYAFEYKGIGALLLINGLSYSIVTSGCMHLAYRYRTRNGNGLKQAPDNN